MAEISLQHFIAGIEEAIDKGRHDEALARGRHILQSYPKHLATYRLLGKAMLEAGQDRLAEDMFRRVLSGDPEDFVARVGMSIIADRRGDVQAAIWHMQRAYELNPNNEAIQSELRRLYGRRDGIESGRVQLTPGALARLYMKGNLFSRAVQEFRSLLAEEPNRVDLRVALAEALWRNEQRVQAEEACLQVLDELPYCFKANAILGEIWTRSGRQEGAVHLQRVEALDPENRLITAFLGESSPLQERQVYLPHFEYVPTVEVAEQPTWMAAAEASRALISAEEAGLSTTMEARIEIPSWLEELGGLEEGPAVEEEVAPPPAWTLGPAEAVEEVAEQLPSEELPDWMKGEREEEVVPGWQLPVSEELPDWLAGVAPETLEAPPAAGVPDWLREVSAPPSPAAEEEVPDWLRAPEAAEEVTPEAKETLDWLRLPQAAEEEVAAGLEEEVPDWLLGAVGDLETIEAEQELPAWLRGPAAAVEEEIPPPEPTAVAEPQPEAALPSWLEGEGLPEGDEALAWLESLAAGKEEELRATAEAEAQLRMAEIMGRPKPTPAPEPEVPPAPFEPIAAVELQPEAAGPQPAEAALPSWLQGEGLPEGDEALAWLESLAVGKEEELRATAEAEAQLRMAEIMGRPKPVPEPAAPPEVPEAAIPGLAPPEVPDWLREMAPPEAFAAPEELAAGLEAAPEEAFPWPPLEEVEEEGGPFVELPAEAEEEPFGWIAFETEGVLEVPPPEVEKAPEEVLPLGPEAFGWTTFGVEEGIELVAPEEMTPSAPAVEVPSPLEEFGWTGFAPLEAEAAPEAVPPAGEIVAPVVEPETAPLPPVEIVPPLAEPEVTLPPAVEIVPPAPPALQIEERAEGVRVEVPREPRPAFDDTDRLRDYVRTHPRDHEARLALARALWARRNYEESLELYDRLVRLKPWAEEVMADMEDHLRERPNDPAVRRLLGDAYMRLGLLEEALRVYREALEGL